MGGVLGGDRELRVDSGEAELQGREASSCI